MPAELRAYQPSLRERAKATIQDALGGTRRELAAAERLTNVLDLTPAGVAFGVDEAMRLQPKDEHGAPLPMHKSLGSGLASSAMLAASLPFIPAPARKALGKVAKTPIRAYHGSPHDFDRFDMSKIGTGEGAQVYGHGLYFAEHPETARAYRDKLAGHDVFLPSGKRLVRKPYTPEIDVARILREANGDFEQAKLIAKRERDQYAARFGEGATSHQDEVISKLRELHELGAEMRAGRMYEVDIHADPEDFLDWDAPLAEQPAAAQALARVMDESGRWGRPMSSFPARGRDLVSRARRAPDTVATGQTQLETLRDAGIPGIKYLDQISRQGGEGTRNYVLFRDDIIEIVRKYGIAGAAALTGLSQAEIAEAAQPQGGRISGLVE